MCLQQTFKIFHKRLQELHKNMLVMARFPFL